MSVFVFVFVSSLKPRVQPSPIALLERTEVAAGVQDERPSIPRVRRGQSGLRR